MKTALLQKVLCCIMVVVLPAALFATDSGAAMLYSNGTARLNGTTLPRSSAIFPGDLVQTSADSVAKINAVGTSLMVFSDTLVQFDGNAIKLEQGSVAVTTSKGMATRAGEVTVTPKENVWTQFDVKSVDGQIQITAQKGDVSVSDGAGTTTLAQGQQTTREEPQPEQNEKKKKKRRAGGAVPGAGGGVLDSPLAIGVGVGAVAGLTTWVLIQGDEPVSPKR
jgi:ferric-dicitrate binding protein FerR (iron transport regulator)